MTTATVANHPTSTQAPVNGSHKVAEIDWSDVMAGNFPENPAKKAWREAIMDVAEQAKTKLPQCASRIANAVKIVLAGNLELHAEGTATVRSATNGKSAYQVADGRCTCRDFRTAFEGLCVHRLAYAIHKKARLLTTEKLQDLDAPAHEPALQNSPEAPIAPPADSPVIPAREVAHTEAPASANTYLTLQGYRVQLTLRSTDEHEVLARLAAVLTQFPLADTAAESRTTPPVPEGWCRRHDVEMTEHFKDDRSWFSHFVDGKWCRGK